MSNLYVNTVRTQDVESDLAFKTNDTTRMVLTSAGTLSGLTTGSISAPGMVLQVVQYTLTSALTIAGGSSSTSWWSALSGGITPVSTNSKILITANVPAMTTAPNYRHQWRLERGSSAIDGAIGDAAGDRQRATQGSGSYYASEMSHFNTCYLDSPATTSEVIYRVAFQRGELTEAIYINRNANDDDSTTMYRGASFLTLQEIAG